MAKKVILGALALMVFVIVVLSVVVAMQPAEFKVTRSLDINAPTERIFEQVNDFRKWDAWSPWARLDPNMKTTYSGPDSGVGASYAWTGNDEVGDGRMTIKNTHPPKYLAIDLEFIKPFEAKNLTQFDFKAMGEKTNVTWTMVGKKDFMMKAFCLVMDMDKAVGSDFEKGLAQLKTVAETAPPQ
ncbi:MAG: SRPBCC family protein [Chloracidobacterium sp.]|nr:SRPBCC family protein [Chloracidobacterium sp.]